MPSRFQRFSVIVEDGRGEQYLQRVRATSPDDARAVAIKHTKAWCKTEWPNEKDFLLMTRDKFSAKYTFRGHVREA